MSLSSRMVYAIIAFTCLALASSVDVTTRERFVWFEDSTDTDSNRDIVNRILELPGIDQDSVKINGPWNPEIGPDWVVAYITREDEASIRRWPFVAEITKPCAEDPSRCKSKEKRKAPRTEWKRDQKALREFVFLSYPTDLTAGERVPGLSTDYVYDKRTGEGATIYVIEEGANFAHHEFDDAVDQKRLKHVGPDYKRDPKTRRYVPEGPLAHSDHGTEVLSKIVGKTAGVAKRAKVILAQMEGYDQLIGALSWIHQDWSERGPNSRTGVAVLNMSFTYFNMDCEDIAKLQEKIAALVKIGILPICGAGNIDEDDGSDKHITTYPQMFGKPETSDYIKDLIVVGSVDKTGQVADFSRTAPWLKFFAPGEDVTVAKARSFSGATEEADGTSFSSALAAAQAGVFVGSDLWAYQVKDIKSRRDRVRHLSNLLRDTTFNRNTPNDKKAYPRALSNGVTRAEWMSASSSSQRRSIVRELGKKMEGWGR